MDADWKEEGLRRSTRRINPPKEIYKPLHAQISKVPTWKNLLFLFLIASQFYCFLYMQLGYKL